MRTLYLCGAGNPEGVRMALRINEKEQRWERIAILDDDPEKHGRTILGVEVVGPFSLLAQVPAESSEAANLVARTTARRWAAQARIAKFGLPAPSLIHPDVDDLGVTRGEGCAVFQRAILGAEAELDDGSVVLMGAIAGHGCRLGRGCVIAPNAVVNARVVVGDGTYIGTNASVLPDVEIGAWTTIAANTTVLQDVPAGATVIGVPGRVVMTLEQKLKLKIAELPEDVRLDLERVGG